jgi:hypothetical protein
VCERDVEGRETAFRSVFDARQKLLERAGRRRAHVPRALLAAKGLLLLVHRREHSGAVRRYCVGA